MTMPPEPITVVCPLCGHEYEDWWRPSINLSLDHFDDKYLEECSSATCPRCGLRVELDTLVVKRDGVFSFKEGERGRKRSGRVRLFELAYACRLFEAMSGFDTTLDRLHQAAPGGIDLDDEEHVGHLLTWLNAWGCRQFSLESHVAASRALQEWGRENVPRLPTAGSTLLAATDGVLDQIVPAYDRLCDVQVAVRHGRSKDHIVRCGPTGAAKILHALRPETFMPWDQAIRSAFQLGGSGRSYRTYLVRAQAVIHHLVEDARGLGIAPTRIAEKIDRPGSSLPKLLDEFYWVTITKEVKVPTPKLLATWGRWATTSR